MSALAGGAGVRTAIAPARRTTRAIHLPKRRRGTSITACHVLVTAGPLPLIGPRAPLPGISGYVGGRVGIPPGAVKTRDTDISRIGSVSARVLVGPWGRSGVGVARRGPASVNASSSSLAPDLVRPPQGANSRGPCGSAPSRVVGAAGSSPHDDERRPTPSAPTGRRCAGSRRTSNQNSTVMLTVTTLAS